MEGPEHYFIGDEEVIEKVLKHPGVSDLKVCPRVKVPSVLISIDDSDFKVPFYVPPFHPDPENPMDSYRISEPSGMTRKVAIFAMDLAY